MLVWIHYFLDGVPCRWFERVSMLVILLNCVTLGMFHPCEDIACDSPRCRILQVRLRRCFYLNGGPGLMGNGKDRALAQLAPAVVELPWDGWLLPVPALKKNLILVFGCEHVVSSGKAPARLCQPQCSQALLGVLGEG